MFSLTDPSIVPDHLFLPVQVPLTAAAPGAWINVIVTAPCDSVPLNVNVPDHVPPTFAGPLAEGEGAGKSLLHAIASMTPLTIQHAAIRRPVTITVATPARYFAQSPIRLAVVVIVEP